MGIFGADPQKKNARRLPRVQKNKNTCKMSVSPTPPVYVVMLGCASLNPVPSGLHGVCSSAFPSLTYPGILEKCGPCGEMLDEKVRASLSTLDTFIDSFSKASESVSASNESVGRDSLLGLMIRRVLCGMEEMMFEEICDLYDDTLDYINAGEGDGDQRGGEGSGAGCDEEKHEYRSSGKWRLSESLIDQCLSVGSQVGKVQYVHAREKLLRIADEHPREPIVHYLLYLHSIHHWCPAEAESSLHR